MLWALSRHIRKGCANRLFVPFGRSLSSKTSDFGEVRHIPLGLTSTLGVLTADREQDIHDLVQNYTAPILAEGLRDREANLQQAAELMRQEKWDELKKLLDPYSKERVQKRRVKRSGKLVFDKIFTQPVIENIRKKLSRIPRQLFLPANSRASVLILLCNDHEGHARMLFGIRSHNLSTHKGEVCFPGGMVDEEDLGSVETALRETEEELGIKPNKVEVLGILRCHWGNVASLTGVAVTPILGYVSRPLPNPFPSSSPSSVMLSEQEIVNNFEHVYRRGEEEGEEEDRHHSHHHNHHQATINKRRSKEQHDAWIARKRRPLRLQPESEEMDVVFSIPLSTLLKTYDSATSATSGSENGSKNGSEQEGWLLRDQAAPVFTTSDFTIHHRQTGQQQQKELSKVVVWGLTGFLTHQFLGLLASKKEH